MKNTIIFYVVLVAAVFGGIQWTAHSLFEKKKVNLDKTNLNQELVSKLEQFNDSLADDLKDQKVVILNVSEHYDSLGVVVKEINDLAVQLPEVKFLIVSHSREEDILDVLSKDKVSNNLPLRGDAEWLDAYMLPIGLVYGTRKINSKRMDPWPIIIALSADGKVKMFSEGTNEKLAEKIKEAY